MSQYFAAQPTAQTCNPQVFQSKRRELVTLRTSQAEITLTPDHRVFVVERRGQRNAFLDKPAGELRKGDIVQVGDRKQQLTNIIRVERDTEAGWCGFVMFCFICFMLLRLYMMKQPFDEIATSYMSLFMWLRTSHLQFDCFTSC